MRICQDGVRKQDLPRQFLAPSLPEREEEQLVVREPFQAWHPRGGARVLELPPGLVGQSQTARVGDVLGNSQGPVDVDCVAVVVVERGAVVLQHGNLGELVDEALGALLEGGRARVVPPAPVPGVWVPLLARVGVEAVRQLVRLDVAGAAVRQVARRAGLGQGRLRHGGGDDDLVGLLDVRPVADPAVGLVLGPALPVGGALRQALPHARRGPLP